VVISISKEQLELGRERCAGLPIELRYQDYRDVTEKFDRITSIEMFEHVGLEYYPTYFAKARECLKDDGIFLFQTGGINVSNFTNIWITKYIFPGAHFPSLAEIHPAIENNFVMEDLYNMGADYDHTLMAWDKNFAATWNDIKDKYDERFYRMWRYFLLSCAAGFRARRAQVWQMVLTPKGIVGGYKY
jgi:cyclopropane-fatty-acyl-phospholipid synthase